MGPKRAIFKGKRPFWGKNPKYLKTGGDSAQGYNGAKIGPRTLYPWQKSNFQNSTGYPRYWQFMGFLSPPPQRAIFDQNPIFLQNGGELAQMTRDAFLDALTYETPRIPKNTPVPRYSQFTWVVETGGHFRSRNIRVIFGRPRKIFNADVRGKLPGCWEI